MSPRPEFVPSQCRTARPPAGDGQRVGIACVRVTIAAELSNIPADMFGGSDALISCTGRLYESCGSHAWCVTDVNGA